MNHTYPRVLLILACQAMAVWIGSSLGILKGVFLSRDETLNYLPAGTALSQTNKTLEVLCMCWDHQSREQLYIGLRNGVIRSFDCDKKYFTAECNLTGGKGKYVGIGKHKSTMITCTDEGDLSFWPEGSEKVAIDAGKDLFRMSVSPDTGSLVATGGKENTLKLWDGTRPDAGALFQARNVKHDSLNLRVPVWVTQIGFVPGACQLLVTATAHHQVRLYDTRAKRRPVSNHEWEDSAITALEMLPDGQSCLLGNSVGDLARMDFRQGKVINRYRGFTGAVSCISVSDNAEDFAACGLDRFLRVYRTSPPALLHKKYLKLHCKALLYNSVKSDKESVEESTEGNRSQRGERGLAQEDDDEDDEMWAELETVRDEAEEQPPTKKKRRTRHH